MGTGQQLYEKAKSLIPGGTQLLSKRPEMFLPDYWPSYYSKAKGCEVWDIDENHYYDCSLMGVGASVLGYAFEPVDKAATAAIDAGGMCSLNAPEEVELAELLVRLHPWAGMVRYSKVGGEAMAMATRIARAHTRRDIVLVCGYHGWHDWYLAANLVKGDPLAGVHLQGLDPAGVPQDLAGSNFIFRYNDIDEFLRLVEEHRGKIAAVIMEPIRNAQPESGFLEKIREVTRQEDIVLVFDEISSGFRLCTGGSHLLFGVEPDIAVFAKGMTNGYPLSAVIGRKDVMQAAQDTFMSSTFWTERVALAAAIASIKFFEKNNVAAHLENTGKTVQSGWVAAAKKVGVDIHVGGIYPFSHFSFNYENPPALKTYFTQEMLAEGFLAFTGFYASFSHTDEIIAKYLAACEKVFAKIASLIAAGTDISAELKGPVCHGGFERLN